MKKTFSIEKYQVVKTLKKLDKWTIRDLKKFMQSDYFVSPTRQALFKVLIKYRPGFNKSGLTTQSLFAAAFPSEKYSHPKIINLFSDLQQLLEIFLVFKFLDKYPFYFNKLKAIQYYKQENFKAFNREISDALKMVKVQEDIFTRFERQSLFNLLHYFPYAEKDELITPHLEKSNQELDELYVINKLRYFCELKSRSKVFDQRVQKTFEEQILSMAKTLKKNNALIEMYWLMYNLDNEKTETNFLATKQKFIEQLKYIPYYEGAILITLLINFTIHKYLIKNDTYLKYQLDLYKLGLKNHFFSPKGYLNHSSYLNIVVTALAAKQVDFTAQFIKDNVENLNDDYKEDCEKLSKGYLYFEQKKYKLAVQEVVTLNSKLVYISLRTLFLELKCNFEFYIESPTHKQTFETKLTGFTTFLESDAVLAKQKTTTYKNFLNILRDIATGIDNKNRRTLPTISHQIKEEINQTFPLVGWKYLLEKVKQLS